jgi:hypothetical protein
VFERVVLFSFPSCLFLSLVRKHGYCASPEQRKREDILSWPAGIMTSLSSIAQLFCCEPTKLQITIVYLTRLLRISEEWGSDKFIYFYFYALFPSCVTHTNENFLLKQVNCMSVVSGNNWHTKQRFVAGKRIGVNILSTRVRGRVVV